LRPQPAEGLHVPTPSMTTFMGFARNSGPAGIRNHVLVIAGELSANPWASETSARVEGCWALTHKHGMGNAGPDRELFFRILSNITTHPNVAGTVLVASGDEDYDPHDLARHTAAAGR